MIHGTTDRETTWCEDSILGSGLSWSIYPDTVNCVVCLRAALIQPCAKCKVRRKVWKT